MRKPLLLALLALGIACSPRPAPPTHPTSRGLGVGYVWVGVEGETSYEVWMNGEQKGRTILELVQRSGKAATYEVRDPEKSEPICRARIRVVRGERVCLECDPGSGEFQRVNCPRRD